MTANHIPKIAYRTLLIAVSAKHLCLSIPVELFSTAAGILADCFPRTTSDQPGLNRRFPCINPNL